eukprot:5114910-Amphidinium_carterae.1
MQALLSLILSKNYLHGILPENVLKATSALRICQEGVAKSFALSSIGLGNYPRYKRPKGGFEGTLPREGLLAMTAVEWMVVSSHYLSGSLPEGLHALASLRELTIDENQFTGALPTFGSQALNIPSSINSVHANPREHFNAKLVPVPSMVRLDGYFLVKATQMSRSCAGRALSTGLSALTVLDTFYASDSLLAGTLPSEGTKALRSLETLDVCRNRLEGRLPEEGLRGWEELMLFQPCANSFEGALPHEVLVHMKNVIEFMAYTNSFAGALPDEGTRSMAILMIFAVHNNQFEGTLPHEAISGMIFVDVLDVSHNRLSGTLPEDAWRLPQLNFWVGDSNHFAGSMPSPRDMRGLSSNDNNFQGTLSMGTAAAHFDRIMLSDNVLEGLQALTTIAISSQTYHKSLIPRFSQKPE